MALVSLFGEKLVSSKGEVKTADVLADKKAIAIYFSAHWCPPCQRFTPMLAGWYTENLQKKGMEVIFVSSDRDEDAFKSYFKDMPWLALPYSERKLKDELSKKYKVQGIPNLVIIDAEGNTITKNGRNAVSNDPTGEDFPWAPKPLKELLGNEFLTKDGSVKDFNTVLGGKTFGLYFSAHWCPPCRGFTPKFAEVYEKVKKAGKNFEVVFASSDQDEGQFADYYKDMPWCAIPFADRKRKAALGEHFECQGIPMLVILDENLNVLSKSAVGAVRNDPEGASFPWVPALVPDVNGDCDGIDEAPSVILLQDKADAATKTANVNAITPVAQKYRDLAKENDGEQEFNFFVANEAGDISGRVASECGVGKWGEDSGTFKKGKYNLVMMNIPENGAYYKFNGDELTTATLEKFLADFKADKLERSQMGSD